MDGIQFHVHVQLTDTFGKTYFDWVTYRTYDQFAEMHRQSVSSDCDGSWQGVIVVGSGLACHGGMVLLLLATLHAPVCVRARAAAAALVQFESIDPKPEALPDRPGRHGLERLTTSSPDFTDRRTEALDIYLMDVCSCACGVRRRVCVVVSASLFAPLA